MDESESAHVRLGRRLTRRLALALVAGVAALAIAGSLAATPELPSRLSDEEFWSLVTDFSESGGTFPSNNYVSNEAMFQTVVPRLRERVDSGGVYIGVGPDQNFTYIVALEPAIAFVVDIRQENLLHHLLYKALIELSPTRDVLLSRLFGRPGVATAEDASIDALISSVAAAEPSPTYFDAVVGEVRDRLVAARSIPLTPRDLRVLESIHRAFFDFGPAIDYAPASLGLFGPAGAPGFPSPFPSFADLASMTDEEGTMWSYLANRDAYASLRDLQLRNLIVPVVGDFAGEKALRTVGDWIREHDATVTTFYTSNVEQYLFQNQVWKQFYDNVASMPLDDTSTFVRAYFPSGAFFPLQARIILGPGETRLVQPPSRVNAQRFIESSTLLDSIQDLLAAVAAGEISTYGELIERSR